MLSLGDQTATNVVVNVRLHPWFSLLVIVKIQPGLETVLEKMIQILHHLINALRIQQLQKSLVTESDLFTLPRDRAHVLDDGSDLLVLLQLWRVPHLLNALRILFTVPASLDERMPLLDAGLVGGDFALHDQVLQLLTYSRERCVRQDWLSLSLPHCCNLRHLREQDLE